MKKRLLSLVLCLVMVFSLFPSFAMAADPEPAADPAGSVYAIGTPGNAQTNPETKSAKYVFHDTQGNFYSFKDATGNTRSYQYVAEGGTLYYPGVPANSDNTLQNARFVGWWTKDGNDWGEQVLNPDTDTAGKTITGLPGTNAVIDLYARYESSYYLVYHTEGFDTASGGKEYRIVAKKLVDQNTDIPLKEDNEWIVRYTPDNASYAFLGWATSPDGQVVETVNLGSSDTLDLYPVLVQAKWIHFAKNDKDSTSAYAAKGATASYTAPAAVQSGHTVRQDYANGLNVPTAPGYTFLGWWNDVDGTRWTNADGSFVDSMGNTRLTDDVYLTAHWEANTVNYTIIVWKQQITDTVEDEAEGTEQYDVEFAEVRQAPTGSVVTLTDYTNIQNGERVTPDNVNYYDFTGFHHDTITPHDNLTATVAPDGSTTLNVYYNRNIVTINFVNSDGSLYIDDYYEEAAENATYYYYEAPYSDGYYLYGYGPNASAVPASGDTVYGDGGQYNSMSYTSPDVNYPTTISSSSAKTLKYNTSSHFNSNGGNNNNSGDEITAWGVNNSGYYYARVQYRSTTYYVPLYYSYSSPFPTGYYREGQGPNPEATPTHIHVQGSSYKGLYEQPFNQWPTESASWYYYKGSSTSTLSFLAAFKLPDNKAVSIDLIKDTAETELAHVYFYLQDIDNTDNYSLDHTYNSSGGTFTITDKYPGYYASNYRVIRNRNSYHSAESDWESWNSPGAVNEKGEYANTFELSQDVSSWMSTRYDYYDAQILYSRKSYNITFMDAVKGNQLGDTASKLYEEDLTGYSATDVSNPYNTSVLPELLSHEGMYFTGWYADSACTTRVFFQEPTQAQKDAALEIANDDQKNDDGTLKYTVYEKMPMKNLVLYAGYENYRYRVWIQPNGGQLSETESSYFNTDWGEVVARYDDVESTRNYAPDANVTANDTWYYIIFDRPDGSASRRSFYVNSLDTDVSYTDGNGNTITVTPAQLTDHVQRDGTGRPVKYKYLSNAYRFNGWYEVDGEIDSTTPPALTASATNQYVFGTPVEENVAIRAEWVRDGIISVVFNPGAYSQAVIPSEDFIYTDRSQGIAPAAPENITEGYYFTGWKLPDGRVVQTNDLYDVLADYAVPENNAEGKPKFVYTLTAQYASVEIPEAKLVYNANGGSGELTNLGMPVSDTGVEVTDFESGTNTLTKLPSNAPIVLSDGAGFTKANAFIIGWNDDQDAANAGTVKFQLGETYGISGGATTLYAVWTETTPATYLIDFGAPMKVAEQADEIKGATNNVLQGSNGKFVKSGTDVTYQLDTQQLSSKNAQINKAYSGVDEATVHGVLMNVPNDKLGWKEITTIPASNIYFDDDLLRESVSIDAGEGFGQNDDITGTAADTNSTGAVRVDVDASGNTAKQTYNFTFHGTGIDIYCTTDSNGGYVTAGIFKQEQNGDWTLISEKTQTIRNYSAEPHYNVPTVSFLNVGEYGTYKVKLNALKNSQYKLDGVRVYGAMANQETVYTDNDAADHANAAFESLRTLLLNDAAKDFGPLVDMTNRTGILYLDSVSTTTDENGNTIPWAYETARDVYTENSPKNEIYLKQGQGIAFTVKDYNASMKVFVGMSVASASTTVSYTYVNQATGTQVLTPTISSTVDQYIEIKPDANGHVEIANTGAGILALTNIQVSGMESRPVIKTDITGNVDIDAQALSVAETPAEEPVVVELVVNEETMRYAATFMSLPAADGTQTDDTTTDPLPNIGELVKQLISQFVTHLFQSISRLFGN